MRTGTIDVETIQPEGYREWIADKKVFFELVELWKQNQKPKQLRVDLPKMVNVLGKYWDIEELTNSFARLSRISVILRHHTKDREEVAQSSVLGGFHIENEQTATIFFPDIIESIYKQFKKNA